MTEEKISILKSSFPDADESSLLELLLSCNGSLSNAEDFLLAAFPNSTPSLKRSMNKQQNIKSLFGIDDDQSYISTNTTNSNKPVYLYSKESIESTIPYATAHFNFLPKELANSLLKYAVEDTQDFKPQEFYLFGNKCISKHVNKLYAAKRHDDYYYNGVPIDCKYIFNDDMKIVQVLIQDIVNKEISERPRFPFQTKDPWTCDLALCNKFMDKSNDLDWHSDRLTYIGPHCIIASLTLGATREFRVRKQYNDTGSKFNTIYSIPLPHNTLLIMHAGFQEEYKHCVSSRTELINNEISGPTRINFTYRNYLKKYKDKMPMCPRCGYQMDLRRSFKDAETRGRYIWTCSSGYQDKECNGFYWAKFNDEEDGKLYTTNLNECSIWLSKYDHLALTEFRKWMNERMKQGEV